MNYTVAELFPGWYAKAVNRDVPADETAIRKAAIESIVKISDKILWVKFIDVYLGLSKFDSLAYNEVVNHVKGNDANFPVQNENLVRFLAGSAIMHRIECDSDLVCPWLALALNTSAILKNASPHSEEFLAYAKSYYYKDCEVNRTMGDIKIGSTKLKTISKFDIPGLANDNATGNKAHSDAVTKAFTQVQKDISATMGETNAINANLDILQESFKVISEECNILWWLFGSFSETLNQPFKMIKKELLPFIVAKELHELTTVELGLGKCRSILSKALQIGEHESGKGAPIDTMVMATHDLQGKSKVITDVQGLHNYAPVLSAIQYYHSYADTEWKVIYNKMVSLDLAQEMTCDSFALQLYLELTLIKHYGEL